MAEGTGYSFADLVAATSGNGGFGGNGGMWIAILFLFVLLGGGGFGGARPATQDMVQGSFNYSNLLDQNRDILNSVTNGTAQNVAATNQTFHDTLNVLQDKYGELVRDVAGVSSMVQAGIANQSQCCCDTKMLIQETAAQNRYDALLNTNSINANMVAGFNSIREKLDENKIEALQGRINQLELQNAVAGVVRYPNGWTYNAGTSPFCNGCGCGA